MSASLTSLVAYLTSYNRGREAHRDFAQHTHENIPDSDSAAGLSQCAMNEIIRGDLVGRELLRMDVDIPPPWAPDRIKAKWESLEGRSWASEYEQELPAPPQVVGPLLRNATDGLTFPQTILWALEKLNSDDAWTKKDTLTVHVYFVYLTPSSRVLMRDVPGAWRF